MNDIEDISDRPDPVLGEALRSLRPALDRHDHDRLTAAILERAFASGARLVTELPWWAVTARWARVALPAAVAAGAILYAAHASQPVESSDAFGLASRDAEVANLVASATPEWLADSMVSTR